MKVPGLRIYKNWKTYLAMLNKEIKKTWQAYATHELAIVSPVLTHLGYKLEDKQPHLSGERYLMQAVTTASGRKLILLGQRFDGKRVVIKISSNEAGMQELKHEKECRRVLREIDFAYQTFLSPEELVFEENPRYVLAIQAFVKQDRPFLERPLSEQFALALKTFKAQESAHATTYGHIKLAKQSFGTIDSTGYIREFDSFIKYIEQHRKDMDLLLILKKARSFLTSKQETIEQYCGFLTHVDLVPHNVRIVENNIYLLDHSSLRFGNKYEGWARFLNFMSLYNPPLAEALIRYVADNRTPEESLALRLMRIFRLGEIIFYYIRALEQSADNLLILNEARVKFWRDMLEAVLDGVTLSPIVIEAYRETRDSLRSAEEVERQRALH